MLTDLTLRLLDPADAGTAAVLVGWLSHEWTWIPPDDPATDPVQRWTRLVAERARPGQVPFTLVAHVDDGPVGCVQVCTDDVHARYADRGPWLSAVYVLPVARDLGVGRALLAETERLTAAQGHDELWLHTGEAHRFYARCGWETVEPKVSVHEDAVMRRSLVG
ncbi:GNAT family N-acetyltransferase [Kineosporia sp. A_224]|uniref:GNAT family N-acetyltransferase n=1 Tax=Kineosporia sp. A_224 TaxID=1962180 RepID=UPI00117B8722|nr:GNAT family N-acetyltransferase [Kineosporia sp. A_224]